jgi:hypothetical protein
MSIGNRIPKNQETRPKWPLSMDLEGFPRDNRMRAAEMEQQSVAENTFFDPNNPPKEPYKHQAFPQMVYNHKTGEVKKVSDEKELRAANQKGFKNSPSPLHDYSQIVNGKAKLKAVEPEEIVEDVIEEEEEA